MYSVIIFWKNTLTMPPLFSVPSILVASLFLILLIYSSPLFSCPVLLEGYQLCQLFQKTKFGLCRLFCICLLFFKSLMLSFKTAFLLFPWDLFCWSFFLTSTMSRCSVHWDCFKMLWDSLKKKKKGRGGPNFPSLVSQT